MKVMQRVDLLTPSHVSPMWNNALSQVVSAVQSITWPPNNTQGNFVIFPECGKRRGKGNGVVPIKDAFLKSLKTDGWQTVEKANPERFDAVQFVNSSPAVTYSLEDDMPRRIASQLSKLGIHTTTELTARTRYEVSELKGIGKRALSCIEDYLGEKQLSLKCKREYVGAEWETGNISSGHRSINRIFRGSLKSPGCIGGIVIAPTRALARYLTDRVTTVEELLNFRSVWEHMSDVWKLPICVLPIEHDATDERVPRILKATDGRNLI